MSWNGPPSKRDSSTSAPFINSTGTYEAQRLSGLGLAQRELGQDGLLPRDASRGWGQGETGLLGLGRPPSFIEQRKPGPGSGSSPILATSLPMGSPANSAAAEVKEGESPLFPRCETIL